MDELQRIGELRHVARLMRAGHTSIVASPLRPAWVRLFNIRWPADHSYTDRSTDKLQHFLEERGVRFSLERVREFGQVHGANYTDIEIILEHSGGEDFDLAFERFRRSARIEQTIESTEAAPGLDNPRSRRRGSTMNDKFNRDIKKGHQNHAMPAVRRSTIESTPLNAA